MRYAYCRPDPTKWHSMPGVVAAYQPVMAPGDMRARANMAMGGDNTHWLTVGVAPGWSPAAGWSSTGSEYFVTDIVPTKTWSLVTSFAGHLGGYPHATIGTQGISGLGIYPGIGSGVHGYSNGAAITNAPILAAGVMAVCGLSAYLNGTFDKTIGGSGGSPTYPLFLLADNNSGTARYFLNTGTLKAVAIVNRTLSAAEIFRVSEQMAYCGQNPEWSVWARRRQWYYGATAGFQAAWARNSNSVIKTVSA